MRQELFRIPGLDVPVHGFGAMVLLGVLSGLWVLGRSARRQGLPPQTVVDSAVLMVLGGLVGARLFYVIQFWDQFRDNPILGPLMLWKGGLVVYGSVFGGIVAFFIVRRRSNLPVLPTFDAMAPAVAVGMGFGRIGCLLNGCCWGKVCDASFPLALVFPPESPPILSEYAAVGSGLHPAQIYASVHAFLIAAILWRVSALRPAPGVVTGVLAVLYGLGRFTLENLRGDHQPSPGEWPVSALISVGVVLVGAILLLRNTRETGVSEASEVPAGNA